MGKNRTSTSPSGGVLRVEARTACEIVLRCTRFRCEGCHRRVRGALESDPGVLSVDDAAGAEELIVRYDPTQLSVSEIADIARQALESDPSNPAPVAVTCGAPLQDAPPAPLRREPASTPIVETHAGIR